MSAIYPTQAHQESSPGAFKLFITRLIKLVLPKEEHFFELLSKIATHALEAASLLTKCATDTNPESRLVTISKIKDIEHQADLVIATIYKELNRTFVTPIDRSDIYNLASALEEITDEISATTLQIPIHAISDLPQGSSKFAELILNATQEIVKGVANINSKHGHLEILKTCKNIKNCEDLGDVLFREETARMFREESDPIKLLKNKEFLEGLERSLDLCDDVGNALSTIVIKNS